MGHIEGESRYQRLLLAPSLDEMLDAAHPVRVIDAFVDTLDLGALGFSKVVAEVTGRPPYRPGDLLKLYIYGYAQQMRSSRRLAREAMRNIEVHWLVNRVSPSFKTIADFRKDHAEAIVGVVRAFIQFCRGQSLFGGDLVAIDGSKVEAVASRKKVITPKGLEKQMAAIDAKIREHLAAMDAADQQEAETQAEGQAGPAQVARALEALRQKRDRAQAQAEALAADGLGQRVLGEQDARLMKTARHGHQPAYNAQSAVDAKHGLIVAFELVNDCNDLNQLLAMAQAAKDALQAQTLTVVADTGYSNGEQGQACEDAGVTAIVPRAQTANPKNPGLFSRDAFAYDQHSDSYTCPAGQTLTPVTVSKTEQKTTYATRACSGCPLKPQCTKVDRRTIARPFHEAAKEAMHQRAMADPRWMKRRRELVEHPFGTMKWSMGSPRFLVRGLKKARSELALAVMAFNLKRTITIQGVPALLEALA